MKIEITGKGIYGAPTKDNKSGEVPIGTTLEVKEEPKEWEGRYRVISDENSEGKEAIINPADETDREDLKKQADELGITYAPNIKTAKLKELVDAKLAE